MNRTAAVTPGTFPAVIDQSSPSQLRSWAGFGVVPGNPPDFTAFPNFGIIDSFGATFAGNWLVRGFGTGNLPCENPADVPWLSVDPTTGTTGAAGTTNVSVTFDSTGLTPGDYSAFLCITSNDPDTPLVELPVALTVADEPANIDVDPLALSATQVADATTQQTLTIANTGGLTLTWNIDEENPAPAGTQIPAAALVAAPATEDVGAAVPAALAAATDEPVAIWLGPTAVLYDNGPLVTNPGGGFGGADASVLQTDLGLSTFGFGHAVTSGFRIADDFTVPAGPGWMIDSFTFFAYQTGSTTASTINALNVRIWDGPPGQAGSNIVFGDTTTNLLTNSTFTNAYRVTNTDLLGNTRPIMASTASMSLYLAPGTYWVDWQSGGTLGSGPWAPPVSLVGQTGKAGANALQFEPTASTWNAAIDTGTALATQDLPFVIEGTEGMPICNNPADIAWLSLDATSGATTAGGSSDVTVTFDSTGLAVGAYTGNLCISSNDPDVGPGNETALVVVPVEMTVAESTFLRVAHLAPFALDPGTAVTVTLNGAPALTDFAHGDSTTYIELPAGEYIVEIFPGSSASPAITGTVNLATGMYYSAVAIGDGVNQDLALLPLADDNTAPATGKFHLRLGHLAPFAAGAATADIRLQDGTLVQGDVDFTVVTGYIELDAGEYDLKITTPGGAITLIDPLPVDFAEGAIVAAFATGEGENQALGVFAWPVDVEGFFLPLVYKLFLPVIFK